MVSFAFFGTFAALALTAHSLSIPGLSRNGARDDLKVLAVKLKANRGPQQFVKRDTVSSPITNKFYLYIMDLELGSNKQKTSLLVDTGSSDMWVVSKGAKCTNAYCGQYGTYDISTSTTAKNLNIPFSETYIDKTNTSGTFITDDVVIAGGATLKALQFGDCNVTSLYQGMLGLGLLAAEEQMYTSNETATPYPNMPYHLKNQGIIKKAAYSLYLDSPNSTTGNVLFGGVDHAKYQGPFTTRNGFSKLRIGITVDSAQTDGQTFKIPGATIFDSGYSFSALPQEIYDSVKKQVSNSDGSLNCNPPADKFIIFNIGETQLKVPLSSLVFVNSNDNNKCEITFRTSDSKDFDNLPTFGDDILRHAYVVYDLEANTVGVAQAQFTDATSITEI